MCYSCKLYDSTSCFMVFYHEFIYEFQILDSVELTTIQIRSVFLNLLILWETSDTLWMIEAWSMKILYWKTAYNQSVLYSSLAEKELRLQVQFFNGSGYSFFVFRNGSGYSVSHLIWWFLVFFNMNLHKSSYWQQLKASIFIRPAAC